MYQQIMCCQVSQKQSWQRSRQGFQNCPVVMGVGRHKVSRKSWKHDEIIDVRTKLCIKSYIYNNITHKYQPNLNEK